MEPAPAGSMTGEYFEDPDLTPQNRWRWAAPLMLLVALPIAGFFGLRETDGTAFWPSHNGVLRGVAAQAPEAGAVGTSGRSDATTDSSSPALIRELETITGQVDGHPLVGSKVDLHVPVAAIANDQAFWVGEKDNRFLVVPRRDHRDGAERQLGLVADHGIALLETGKMAAVTGTIQRVPTAEEMYSWGLTAEDRHDAAARGVYLRADTVSVQ